MDRADIDAVIGKARVCRLAMADGGEPYVVPLCFGYDGEALYFHGGPRGRKMDVLKRNPRVCFEFEGDVEPVPGEQPCRWSMAYRSVIGFGRASVVEGREAKARALGCIMRQYSGRDWEFPDERLDRTTVVRVDIESMTGRQSGY